MQAFPTTMNVVPQQTTISNITVGTSVATTAPKSLTNDSIKKHQAAAVKLGPSTYWQVAKPSRTLKLTGSVAYVTKNYANRPMGDHFVYWEPFRVAGTVSDIVNTFSAAGISSVDLGRGQQQLTQQLVAQTAIDPLNAEHRAMIEQMQKQGTGVGSGVKKNVTLHSLEQYIIIGDALKSSAKNSTTSTVGSKSTGAATGKGGNSPQAKQQKLVQSFNQTMTAALSLPAGVNSEKVFDVTQFDVVKFAKAPLKVPPKTSKATSIQPVVNVQGRQVMVPIIAQQTGAQNFRNFVASVVAVSQYANFAQAIQQSFDQEIQRRSTAIGVQGFMAPQQMTMVQQPAFTGFQTATSLPQVGVSLPQVNMMSQIGGATSQSGSPTTSYGLTSPAPIQLGGSSPRGGISLPRVNVGQQLPMVTGLPTAFAGLPSVGAGGSAFPSIQLPTQGVSPMGL